MNGPEVGDGQMTSQPSDDEFFWESELDLRHGPTGALFTVYPTGAPRMVDWGLAGQTMADGATYFEVELLTVASEIIDRRYPRERPTRPW